MTDIPPVVVRIDNPHAPEVFSGGAAGFFLLNGHITITFESARMDHTQDPPVTNRVIMARVVMPVGGAQDLVLGLNAFLEQQGLSPTSALVGDSARQ